MKNNEEFNKKARLDAEEVMQKYSPHELYAASGQLTHAMNHIEQAFARTNDHVQQAIYEYAAANNRDDIIETLYNDIEPGALPSPSLFDSDPEIAQTILSRAEEIGDNYRSIRNKSTRKQITRHSLKTFASGFTFGAYNPGSLLDSSDPPLRQWLPAKESGEE